MYTLPAPANPSTKLVKLLSKIVSFEYNSSSVKSNVVNSTRLATGALTAKEL
jgi:hypothetical protein